MIRSALIALGLSASGLGAGSVSAQGMVPTAPILAACGGTRLVLEAEGSVDNAGLDRAAEVMSARVGGIASSIFDYTEVTDTQIIVSLPKGLIGDAAAIEPMFERIEVGFYDVDRAVSTGDTVALATGQVLLPDGLEPERSFVLNTPAILDGSIFEFAGPTVDQNNQPAVAFTFTPTASRVFADYTANNIGEPFAIVVNNEIMSAPTIQSVISGGSGIITGNFTNEETVELAAVMQGGVLPFDLSIVATEIMDGSDPSADFCP